MSARRMPYPVTTVYVRAHQQSAGRPISPTASLHFINPVRGAVFNYVKPRTTTKFDERGFCFAGPAARNSLPSHLLLLFPRS